MEPPLVDPRKPNTSIFHLAIHYPVFHNFTATIRLNARRGSELLNNAYNCYTIYPIPMICTAILVEQDTAKQYGNFFFNVENGYSFFNETKVQSWHDERWEFDMDMIVVVEGEPANHRRDFFLRLKLTRDGNVYGNGQWIGTLSQNFAITTDPQFFDVFYTSIQGMAGVDLYFPLEGIVKSTKGAEEYMERIMKEKEYLNKVNGKVGFKPPPVQKFQCVSIFIPCLLIGLAVGAVSAGIYAYKVMKKAYAEATDSGLGPTRSVILSPAYLPSEEDSYFAIPRTPASTDPKGKSKGKSVVENKKKRKSEMGKNKKSNKSKGRKRGEVKKSEQKINPVQEIQATPTVLQTVQPAATTPLQTIEAIPPRNGHNEPEKQYENLENLVSLQDSVQKNAPNAQ
uniref:L-type lectin-like domain-containing protein n=2 Tax=Bursaphelenchus xylophilus TaxID=6326 RepID=A0A1I7RTK8_BURXY